MYKSPLIYDSPFPKTSFDIWDTLPEEDCIRIRARKSMVADYNRDNKNSLDHWLGVGYMDNNSSKNFDEGDDFKYFITIFTSNDAELLADINRIITPLDYEIIFLLEDNSRDVITAAEYYVRTGAFVNANILTSPDFINLKKVLDHAIANGIPKDQLTEEILKKLIDSAKDSGFGHFKEESLKEILYDWFSPLNSTVSAIAEGVSSGIQFIINGLDHLKISSENWNYELGDKDMKLFFFPGYSSTLSDKEEFQSHFENMKNLFREKLMSKKSSPSKSSFTGRESGTNSVFSESIVDDFVNRTFDQSLENFNTIIDEVSLLIQIGIEAYLVYINAFICGFWNSLIASIQGILFLIQLIFKLVSYTFGLAANPERIDHILQLVADFNIYQLMYDFMVFQIQLVEKIKNIDWEALIDSIRIAHLGYFSGAVTEFVLEIVFGAILFPIGPVISGISKLGKIFLNMIEFIVGIVRKAFNLTKGAVADIAKVTLKILRSGADKLSTVFGEIWKAISAWIDNLPLLLSGFKEEILNHFNKLGISIKKIPRPPVLASGIPIKIGDELYILTRDGKEIFRGTKKEVKEIYEKTRKLSDEDAIKYIDDYRPVRGHLIFEVPNIKNFTKWFDDLSIKEFDIVWQNLILRRKIKARLRHPGGLHEWLMVSRADVFKMWGVSASDIKRLRTKIEYVIFKNPPGKHGGPGSTKAHNELLELIDSSTSYNEFKKKLIGWSDKRLLNGIEDLPKGFFD